MRFTHIFRLSPYLVALVALAAVSVQGQEANDALKDQVGRLADQGDYGAVVKIIDEQENLWKTEPSMDYFRNMSSIADILHSSRDARFYWLGRKATWRMLLKPAPNDPLAVRSDATWTMDVLFGAEQINNGKWNREMYAAIRHDMFLMFAQYARQANAVIIPGFHNKFPGATNSAEYAMNKEPYRQNRVDDLVQAMVREELGWLQDQTRYLIEAYSTEPRNDEELKQLLDILNIQGADRKKVMDDSR